MTTFIEEAAGLVVGTVESVAPDDIHVLLDLAAPQTTALNAGTPSAFPRINGYVLIPNEAGATVGYIGWMGIERAPFPKRLGMKDFGLIDLPFPLRKMAVSPVGTLISKLSDEEESEESEYELSRGVAAFPSVGDPVLMPTRKQLEAIVGSQNENRRVRIGTSSLAGATEVRVDPDKLFGRHLAVLGNTGSGKSCTVAGLIRWSLDAAKNRRRERGKPERPNARFIVLDPNGEYARAFQDIGDECRIFQVPDEKGQRRQLRVPAWMWNGREWSAIAKAAPNTQHPVLMQALRELRATSAAAVSRDEVARQVMWQYLAGTKVRLSICGTPASVTNVGKFETLGQLTSLAGDATSFAAQVADKAFAGALREVAKCSKRALDARTKDDKGTNKSYPDAFSFSDIEPIVKALESALGTEPPPSKTSPISEDVPLSFSVQGLAETLERIASDQGGNLSSYVRSLGLRLRALLSDARLTPMVMPSQPITLEAWLADYVGEDDATNGNVAILDLSLVPSDVIHVVIAVLARIVFEALQRYRKLNSEGDALPTVLVLEEAHTFVRRQGREEGHDETTAITPTQLCRETFERIAREGRKFGLGLVLSSQRPSELSQTVLAQCNTFLLHRIVNDKDQELVSKLVPDNLGRLLRELPSLPSRQAILLGWATPIPVLVEIDELSEKQRPQSADPDFWDVWTGKVVRNVDWKAIVDDWTLR